MLCAGGPPKASVLWVADAPEPAARNQQSYRTVLAMLGYEVSTGAQAPKEPDTLLIVPEASGAKLNAAQQDELVRYLASGGHVVAEGRQPWLAKLGIEWQEAQRIVASVSDQLYPEMTLRWRPEARLNFCKPPAGVRVLLAETNTGEALAFTATFGRGRYLHLAAPLDPYTTDGTSRYPYFPKYLTEAFDTKPATGDLRIEAYFDPAYRPGADPDRLAAQWRRNGIRTIYAAAWASFDYRALAAACHREGIALYAWLAFPEVTPRMWDEHPEWREKTATGADALVGWRHLMNLQNPDCFRAAMAWMNEVLRSSEWDGVNLTEINFDADFLDYLRPDRMVPFSTEARQTFRARAGFDPLLLFDQNSPHFHRNQRASLEAFLQYREDIVTDWHRRILAELEPLRRERKWEVIVTILDSLSSDYVRPALGVDSRRIAALMTEFPFTLQVEDPAEHWMKPPDRYLRFAESYRTLVPDPTRLMFDINVVTDRDISGTTLPSGIATGTELARTAAAAASRTGRVAIYSEHTVPAQDWVVLQIVRAVDSAPRRSIVR